MAPKIYRHPRTAETMGHRGDCKYENNSSPACACEQEPHFNIMRAMKLLGWKVDDRAPGHGGGTSYYRSIGPHIVTVALCMSGWQFKWEKGPGFTYIEETGFGTIGHCLSYFWGMEAQRLDELSQMSWEHAAMTSQLKTADIEPRRFGVKPKPKKPAVPGPLKHEVTAIMNKKGDEDVKEKAQP